MKDDAIVKLFCAIGNSYRIDIIRHILDKKELNVKGVTECIGFLCDQSVVSKHLKILKDAGILKSRSQGTNVFYSISIVIKRHLDDLFISVDAILENVE